MAHSIIGADRGTHLKIEVVALTAAILVVLVGVTARVADFETMASIQRGGPVLKAGKPTTFSVRDDAAIR
jgi:hypothetical protein